MNVSLHARLDEIRAGDGAQKFTVTDTEIPEAFRTVWLTGINRVFGLKLGDTGYLTYTHRAGHGHYTFRKD